MPSRYWLKGLSCAAAFSSQLSASFRSRVGEDDASEKLFTEDVILFSCFFVPNCGFLGFRVSGWFRFPENSQGQLVREHSPDRRRAGCPTSHSIHCGSPQNPSAHSFLSGTVGPDLAPLLWSGPQRTCLREMRKISNQSVLCSCSASCDSRRHGSRHHGDWIQDWRSTGHLIFA